MRLRISITMLILCFYVALKSQEIPILRLHSGHILLENNFDPRKPLKEHHVHRIPGASDFWGWIQCTRLLNKSELQRITSSGIQIEGYISDYTYYLRIPVNIQDNPLADLPVYAFAPLTTKHVLSGALQEKVGNKQSGKERLSLVLHLHNGLSPQLASQVLLENDFPGGIIHAKEGWIDIHTSVSRLYALAALGLARYIDIHPGKGEPEDMNGRSMHRAGFTSPSGLPFTGAGINLLIRDDGRIGPHINYQGRLDQRYCYRQESNGSHGDMVTGIAAGAGNVLPFSAGMATGATIFTEDYNGDFPEHTVNLIQKENITVTNSSYSDNCNTGYTIRAQRIDQQLYDMPYLMHVFSAGNAGTSDCNYGAGPFWGNITGGHKAGKNAITTANLYNDFSLVQSSSRGPVHDGRLKPDLSAHGQGQLTTYQGHQLDAGGGTSAAAPGVAGVFAQLAEAWKYLHPNQEIPAALLKTTLLNTAVDLGQPGPDFIYGWGHLNGAGAWHILQNKQYSQITLSQGEKIQFDIDVPPNMAEARFMIYWTDPPAMEQAEKALINDLDLSVRPAASNTDVLPLVLDPTPNPTALSAPAVPGIDRTNNVEQVRVLAPIEGKYHVSIDGYSIPFGNAQAWLVWHFLDSTTRIVYPVGGEAFQPARQMTCYWDAYPADETWDIYFSIDSGNTWELIETQLDAHLRSYTLTLPSQVTTGAALKIVRNGIETISPAPFTLFPEPVNIKVTKACPDSIWYVWDGVAEADQYEIHLLGEKYFHFSHFESNASTIIPTWNPLAPNWIAVSARNQMYNYIGERSSAFNFSGGLLNCKQPYDLRVSAMPSPSTTTFIACDPLSIPVTVSLRNEGSNAVTNLPVFYQIDDQSPVGGILGGNFTPNSLRFYGLNPSPQFDTSGVYQLKIWTDWPDEAFRFNDTLYTAFTVSIQNKGILYPDTTENFEAHDEIPAFWQVQASNSDGITWQIYPWTDEFGIESKAIVMPNYFYDQVGALDLLSSPQIDLTGTGKPMLLFDLAYGGLFGNGYDTLSVWVLDFCVEQTEELVYQKMGQALITPENPSFDNEPFIPYYLNDWRTEIIDLSPFKEKRVLLQWVNHAGYGNNLWMDNIRIIDTDPALSGSIILPSEPLCSGQPFLITGGAKGNPASWHWDFGADAEPPFALGEGPHTVYYTSAGIKVVTLTLEKDGVQDITTKMVTIQDKASAEFTGYISGDTLFILPVASGNYSFQWWTELSTEVFTQPTNFAVRPGGWPQETLVTLIATNECGSDTLSLAIKASSTQAPIPSQLWHLCPNPANTTTVLGGTFTNDLIYLELIDVSGKVVFSDRRSISPGDSIVLDTGSITAGSYHLRIKQGDRYLSLPLIKM